MLTYADRALSGEEGSESGEGAGKESEEKREKPVDPPVDLPGDLPVDLMAKKYRSYVLVGVTKAYLIRGECPEKEFAAFEEEFDRVARDFQLILRNRW